MKEITPDDVRKFCDEQQTVVGLKHNLNHMGRLFLQSEEVVVEERSRNIILSAQRDKLLTENERLLAQLAAFRAENERLERQVNRQAETIAATDADCATYKESCDLRDTESSVALANAQTRIHYLQNELARAKSFGGHFPKADHSYDFTPKSVTLKY